MAYADVLFLVGRLLLGGYFLRSGFNHFKHAGMMAGYAASKGVPSSKVAVMGSGVLLVAGGLGVLLGVYVNLAVATLVLFLVPVTFMMHAFWKVQDPMQKMGESVNFYKNLALIGAVLMLLSIPQPWDLSLQKSTTVRSVDAAFIEEMIPHHEDAILMAEEVKEGAEHAEIRQLADSIIAAQSAEIAQMKAWYKAWFGTDVSDDTTYMMRH